MQFLEVSNDLLLVDLSERIGFNNVDNTLVLNNLIRQPDIGGQLSALIQDAYANTENVDWQRKSTILNKYVADDDIFETVALLNESDWKALSTYNIIPGYITIPETVELADANDVLGSGEPIGTTVYNKAIDCLSADPHIIDPAIFNSYSTSKNVTLTAGSTSSVNPMNWFNLPWGKITLYSDLTGDYKDFPVYPEEYSDNRTTTYDQMQDLLYQYEPWYVYHSSGPRQINLDFNFHRDMWSGDHTDGQANDLIRFCESFCYPFYDGSAVYTDTCSLYINGSCYIHGIITDVQKKYSGPLGQDGMPLYVELTLSFTEVANQVLDNSAVKSLGLIG